jgi:hypothetical protein
MQVRRQADTLLGCRGMPDPALESEIRILEERLLQATTRSSRGQVEELLSNDFVEFGSSGRVFDKQAVIEYLTGDSPAHFSMLQFRVKRLAPDVVLATYIAVTHLPGAPPRHSLRSSIWTREGYIWQLTFHQGTRTAQPK